MLSGLEILLFLLDKVWLVPAITSLSNRGNLQTSGLLLLVLTVCYSLKARTL